MSRDVTGEYTPKTEFSPSPRVDGRRGEMRSHRIAQERGQNRGPTPRIAPWVSRRGRGNVILSALGNPDLRKDGSPVTAWNERRAVWTGRRMRNPAADRIPVLDGDSLAALAYNP